MSTVVSIKRPPRGTPEHKALVAREREERLAAAVAKGVTAGQDEFAKRDEEAKAAQRKQMGGYEKLGDVLAVHTDRPEPVLRFLRNHMLGSDWQVVQEPHT